MAHQALQHKFNIAGSSNSWPQPVPCPLRRAAANPWACGTRQRCRSDDVQLTARAAASPAGAGDDSQSNSEGAHPPQQPPQQQQQGPLQWLKERFGSSKLDKQKLAEYGLGAFAAYGIISNLNAGVLVTMSWLTVVKQTGLTPLDPGMWPRFLGIYAGLYVAIGSLLRPLRLTAALAAAPFFNKALEKLQQVFRVNKAVAFGLMLGCIAVSSFTLIACMLVLAGGFPNGPPPLPWKR